MSIVLVALLLASPPARGAKAPTAGCTSGSSTGASTVPVPVPSFADLGLTPWARVAVEALWAMDVMDGTGPTTFDPQGTTNRAQAAVVLNRLLPSVAVAPVPAPPPFADEDQIPSWARVAAAVVAQRHMLKGQPGGAFEPNGPVTWAQLAVMAARAFNYPVVAADQQQGLLASLPDGAATPPWADEAVSRDLQAGVFTPILTTRYRPNQPVSRAALAVFLLSAVQASGDSILTPNGHLWLAGLVTAVSQRCIAFSTPYPAPADGPATFLQGCALGCSVHLVPGPPIFVGASRGSVSQIQPGDAIRVVVDPLVHGAYAPISGLAADWVQAWSPEESAAASSSGVDRIPELSVPIEAVQCPRLGPAYTPPSAAALLYVTPRTGVGVAEGGCPAAVDWSGRFLGAIPAPSCVEACFLPAASPDGRILIEQRRAYPTGAMVPLDTAGYVWSPDSRYLCGLDPNRSPAVTGGLTLLWKTPLGTVHRVPLHLPTPKGLTEITLCDPAHKRVIVVDQYAMYTRAVAVVDLSDGQATQRWSFPGLGPDNETGSHNGVYAVFSLDGRVVAENFFTTEGVAAANTHAISGPILRSTETGRVLATLPLGWVLSLNAPGSLALFEGQAKFPGEGFFDIQAIHSPWERFRGVVSGVTFTNAAPEPGGTRLAVDVAYYSHDDVLVLGGHGSVRATLNDYALLAPKGNGFGG